ncbi:MAG: phage tail tape measure protein [Halothiobacillaceae bacterium]|nr:MAG: phage tail tape measure protein [Halothiobacillaceae bacterium]
MSSTALALGLTLSFYDKLSAPLKAARGTLNSTSKAAGELQEQLSEAAGLSKQLARFDAMKRKTLEYNEAIAKAKQRVADLSAQIASSEKPSKKMESALGAAKRQLEQLSEGSYRHRARMQEMQQTLEKGGVSTKRLSAEQARLRGEMDQLTTSIKHHNEAAARAAQVRERLNKASTIAAAGGAAAVGVGMAARPLFDSSVRAFAELENASVRLKSSMTDATGQISPLFTQIDGLAKGLGAALPGTTRDFYAMFEVMLNSGVGAQSIIDGVGESAAKLAVVLNVSYDEAAKAVSRLKNATGVADGEMLGFLDTVQRTKSLGVDLGEMEYAFSRSAGKLKELNIQGLGAASTMSVLYASWIRSGLSGETVGTGFASALNSMQQLAFGTSKKSAEAREMLQGLGIQLRLFDGKGNFKGVENMVSELDKLRTLDPADLNQVLTQIFGTGTDAQMVAALIKDGRDGFDKLTSELNAKAGLAAKADMQTATLANLWEAVSGTWDNLKAKLIGSIQTELKGAIGMIGQFQGWLDGIMTRFPEATKHAATLLTALAIFAPVVGGLAIGIAGLLRVMAFAGPGFAVMATAGRAVGAAIMFIGRALLMNPIGLILTGIATAAFLVWQNWDTVKGWLVGAWEWIKGAAVSMANGIKWAFLNMTPVGMVIQHWDQIKTTVGGFVDYIAGLPSRMLEYGKNIAKGLADGVKGALGSVRDSVVGMADGSVGWVKETLGIHSPSRVFAQLGGYISEGLGVGISDKAQLALQAAGRLGAMLPGALPTALAMGVTAGAAVASPGMAATGANAGTTIINISVTAPAGTDGQALAKLVAHEIEKIQRGQTARARGRLYDEV